MANPIGYDRRLYGDPELFGLNLDAVLEAYTSNYDQFPDSPDDMIVFIDRITDSDYSFYQDQRDYFLRNKNKLIFVKDSLSAQYKEYANSFRKLMTPSILSEGTPVRHNVAIINDL